MFNITFNPGPSQISEATKVDIQTAVDQRWLEISHRSPQFSDISRHCITELRQLLGIPDDYRIFYLDSASQAWHSILCNVVAKNSFHFVNGAFSEKCYKAAQAVNKVPLTDVVEWGQQNNFSLSVVPDEAELITVCANETSTGVFLDAATLQKISNHNPDKLLAVDITSCAGAVKLPISQADLWYFSVQKCFGLPAGLGILMVSPRAYQRSLELAGQGQNLAGIWQWEKLAKPMEAKDHQTPQTPNVLNIYLLGQQAARWNKAGGLKALAQQTEEKMHFLSQWVSDRPDLDFFVTNPVHRSPTVLTVRAQPEVIQNMHQKAQIAGFKLGSGYGKTKTEVFRVANFPAIGMNDLQSLTQALA